MRKLFFSLSLLALLFVSARIVAFAETPERIASLSISIWPEYDDPGVLVIYEGEFADKTGFPRETALLVPTNARVTAAAYASPNGEYLNTDPWKLEDAGNGWTRVSFKLPTPNFHLEFYYNPLQGAPNKTMDFVYNAAQNVDKLEIEVQEPLKSSNFKTNPAAVLQTARGHDFKYHVLQYPALSAGQTVRVQISYTKSDPNPSVANISIPAATPADATRAASDWIVPVVLAASGLGLGVLGFIAWRARRQDDGAEVERPQPRRKKKARSSAVVFCHECGNGLRAEDVFCNKCGTRRKGM